MSQIASRHRIVLVDDSDDDRLLVTRALRKLPYAVEILPLEDGLTAIDYFSAVKVEDLPDLVILDVKLPKHSGFDVLRAIRGRKLTSGLKVVVMSSSDEPQDVEQALLDGADEYSQKAVHPEAFIRNVRSILSDYVPRPLARQKE